MAYKILLVEDDEILLNVYSSYLIDEGLDVTTALNGEEALEKIKRSKFDLLVTDVKMPGLSGIQLIKKCKEIQPEIPSIIVSGHASVSEAAEAVNLRVFHFLRKPIRDLHDLKRISLEAIDFYAKPHHHRIHPASADPPAGEMVIPPFIRKVLLETYLKPRFGIFTTGLAHNINSPLGGVLGYAQLTAMKHPDIPALDTIADQATKASAMLTQVADKGHAENSRKRSFVDLAWLTEKETAALAFNLFYKHNLQKEVSIEHVPHVDGVYAHFSQILNQLVQNAADAVYPTIEKFINISLTSDDNHVIWIIKDTGEGIPPQNMDKIFLPGFSTRPLPEDLEDAEMPGGYGLGLYVVKELLEEYNGTIDIQTKLKKGTTVTVKIPHEK